MSPKFRYPDQFQDPDWPYHWIVTVSWEGRDWDGEWTMFHARKFAVCDDFGSLVLTGLPPQEFGRHFHHWREGEQDVYAVEDA